MDKGDDLEMQQKRSLVESVQQDDSTWLHCLVFPRVMEDEEIHDAKKKLRRAFSRRAVANWESSEDPEDVAMWKKLDKCNSMKKSEFMDIVFKRAISLIEHSGVQIGIRTSVDADEVLVLLDIETDDKTDTTLETIAEASEVIIPVSKEAYHFKHVPIPQMGRTWSQRLFGFDKLASRDAKQYCVFSRWRQDEFRTKRDNVLQEARVDIDSLKQSGNPEALKGRVTHYLHVVSTMTTLADDIRKALHTRWAEGFRSGCELGSGEGLSEADMMELLEISELSESGMAKFSDTQRRLTNDVKTLLKYFTTLCEFILNRDKERRGLKTEKDYEDYQNKTPKDLLSFRLRTWTKVPLAELSKAEFFHEFTSADVLKILRTHLHSILDVEAAQAAGIITGSFPLHEREACESLNKDWGGLSFKRIFSLPNDEHADEVRDYFGEKIAFFFSWLCFETRMLLIPVIISLLARLRFLPCFHYHSNIFEKAFSWGMVVWLSFTVSAFRQDSFKLNLSWGMMMKEVFGKKLPSFNDADRGGIKESLVRAFHWAVVAFFFFETIAAAYKINMYRAYALDQREAGNPQDLNVGAFLIPKEVIAQYAIVVNIKVVSLAWAKISPIIAKLENRRTDMRLEDSQVIKNFLVMSVVNYYPFFYLAFIKRYVVKRSCSSTGENGMDGCLAEMEEQVVLFFVTNIVVDFAKIFLHVAMVKYKVYKDLANAKHLDGVYSDAEAQSKRPVYVSDLQDFLAIIIELGFIVMLCAPLPIMVVIILLTNMLKLRMFAWRMLNVFQRPIPYGRHDIGEWRVVLQGMCFFSSIVCLAMHLFAQSAKKGTRAIDEFICFEHLVLFVVFLGMQAIPQRALSEVKVVEQQAEDIFRLFQFTEKEKGEDDTKEAKKTILRRFPEGGETPGCLPPKKTA